MILMNWPNSVCYANSDANKLFIFAIIEFSINMHMFAIQHLKQTLPAVLFKFHKRSKIHPPGGAWGKKFFKSDKDSPPHHRRGKRRNTSFFIYPNSWISESLNQSTNVRVTFGSTGGIEPATCLPKKCGTALSIIY